MEERDIRWEEEQKEVLEEEIEDEKK